MPVEFKVFFDNEAADQEKLDKIDEIRVEQTVDRAWEARVKIPVCVNNDGKWDGENEAWMRDFSRVRVEVNMGDGAFAPLIDGPIVGFDSERSPQPGKSVVTLIVHDDSAFLNRQAGVECYENSTDSEIARQIFGEATELSGTPDIEDTPAQPNTTTSVTVRRGTKMQFLRELARRNQNWHAYVLPGSSPGQSIGAFRKFPTDTDGLPPMLLLGADRNIAAFNVRNNAQNPCSVTAATMNINDKTLTTSTSSFRNSTLIGDQSATLDTAPEATCILPPGINDSVDLASATGGRADDSSFSLEATGSVVPFCYPAALSPYRMVLVKISNSQYSTKYLITQVTHTLTRSNYTQSFSMKGNAVSAAESGSAAAPSPSAGFNASFNIQMSIF